MPRKGALRRPSRRSRPSSRPAAPAGPRSPPPRRPSRRPRQAGPAARSRVRSQPARRGRGAETGPRGEEAAPPSRGPRPSPHPGRRGRRVRGRPGPVESVAVCGAATAGTARREPLRRSRLLTHTALSFPTHRGRATPARRLIKPRPQAPTTRRAPLIRSGGPTVPVLFAVTLFVSASLLFMVQPMVGKMILPLLGGSPAAWNTCMVFFQALLLLGYLYAHHVDQPGTTRGRQTAVHLGGARRWPSRGWSCAALLVAERSRRWRCSRASPRRASRTRCSACWRCWRWPSACRSWSSRPAPRCCRSGSPTPATRRPATRTSCTPPATPAA